MKRILFLIALLGVSVPVAQARDIVVSSWVELTDQILQPDDCIIKVEKNIESGFKMPKAVEPSQTIDLARRNFKESSTEQYPNAQVVRYSRDQVIENRQPAIDYWQQSLAWDKACEKNQKKNQKKDLASVETVEAQPRSGVSSYGHVEVVDSQKSVSGERYCIEEDSWWKARVKKREARRIVLVPAEQRNACWRSVLVIQPKIFNDGYKFIGTNFTYEALEEYRFSNPLKIAAWIGLSAGLLALIKTIS